MIVYMLLNLIEERAYIGSTVHTLKERWKEHHDAARTGGDAPLHTAMRKWNEDELWLKVVLANCYDEQELERTEQWWVDYCCATDSAVGYNSRKTVTKRKADPRAPMSEEQREFYRLCGRRGTRPKAELTDEERAKYREWGRRGAEASKLKRQD